MHHAGARAHIDQPVEHLPSLAAQPADPTDGRRDCQRDEQYESRKAGGDEWPLHNVFQDLVPIKKFVQHEPGQKMQAGIEEAEQPQRAAKANQVGQPQEFSQRRDGECDAKEADRPVPCPVRDELDRIRTQVSVQGSPPEQQSRHQAEGEDRDLHPAAAEDAV